MKRVAAALPVLLLACGDDGGTAPSPDAGIDAPSNACTVANDMCIGENVCVQGTCMAAFPRAYVMEDVAIMLPAMNAGSPWDPADNPDPYIAIAVDGVVAVSSTPAPNTLTQTFPGPFDITLGVNAALSVTIYDEDGANDERAFECRAMPVTAGQLRSGSISCTAAEGSVAFQISAKGP